jgi:hypothetical protein
MSSAQSPVVSGRATSAGDRNGVWVKDLACEPFELSRRRARAATLTLDTLGDEHLGPDGTYAEFLSGLLIQSDAEPPVFVDLSAVRQPDLVCILAGYVAVSHSRKRVYNFKNVGSIPNITVQEWTVAVEGALLHPECKRVAHQLSKYATFDSGKDVRPAMGTIAAELSKDRTSVNRHTRRLVRDGWLTGTGKARKGVIIYALSLPSS